MGEEPEKMLPEDRTTAARPSLGDTLAYHQARWHEEARAENAIRKLHETGCFQRGEGEHE